MQLDKVELAVPDGSGWEGASHGRNLNSSTGMVGPATTTSLCSHLLPYAITDQLHVVQMSVLPSEITVNY